MGQLKLILLTFALAVITSALNQTATCYNPDGSGAYTDLPCFTGQDVSACCSVGEGCTASGLCKAAGSVGVSNIIRRSCTDAKWESDSCPQYCDQSCSYPIPQNIYIGIELMMDM